MEALIINFNSTLKKKITTKIFRLPIDLNTIKIASKIYNDYDKISITCGNIDHNTPLDKVDAVYILIDNSDDYESLSNTVFERINGKEIYMYGDYVEAGMLKRVDYLDNTTMVTLKDTEPILGILKQKNIELLAENNNGMAIYLNSNSEHIESLAEDFDVVVLKDTLTLQNYYKNLEKFKNFKNIKFRIIVGKANINKFFIDLTGISKLSNYNLLVSLDINYLLKDHSVEEIKILNKIIKITRSEKVKIGLYISSVKEDSEFKMNLLLADLTNNLDFIDIGRNLDRKKLKPIQIYNIKNYLSTKLI